MPADDRHLLELCRGVSHEKDSDKLARLIRELNQELAMRESKKHPESSKDDKKAKRIRCA